MWNWTRGKDRGMRGQAQKENVRNKTEKVYWFRENSHLS